MAKSKLTSRIPFLLETMKPKAARIVLETAQQITSRAAESMAGPKSGRMYENHQASAPGEAPAIDTGLLANSQVAEMTGITSAIAGFAAEYAPHLEFGTARMQARPFLSPAVEAESAAFVEKLKGLFRAR